MADKLDQIFVLQSELNARVAVPSEMSEQERIEWILKFARALNQECAELVDCVPWKWWAKYQSFNQQNARVEVIDLLHCVISIAQTLGMSSTDLFEAYLKKHDVNMLRQQSGYEKRDQTDSAHI